MSKHVILKHFQKQEFWAAGLLLALLAGLMACSRSQPNATLTNKAKQGANVTTGPAGAQPVGGGDVPWAITDLGELAERVYEDADTNHWTQAANKMAVLNAACQAAHGVTGKSADQRAAQTTKSLDEAVHALNAAVRAKDRQLAMLNANQVTMLAGELASPFTPQVPLEVTRLDYDGRQLKVWAQAQKPDELKATTRDMATTWDKLRPRVLQNGGGTEAKRFDHVIVISQAAGSLRQYSDCANAELNEVANLEELFLRSSVNPNAPS
jgi:hypothetical protein